MQIDNMFIFVISKCILNIYRIIFMFYYNWMDENTKNSQLLINVNSET